MSHTSVTSPLRRLRGVILALTLALVAAVSPAYADNGPTNPIQFFHHQTGSTVGAGSTFLYGENVYMIGNGLPYGKLYYRIVDLHNNQQIAWGDLRTDSSGHVGPLLVWANPTLAGDSFELDLAAAPYPATGQHNGVAETTATARNVNTPSTSIPPTVGSADFFVDPPGMDVPEVPTPALYVLGLAIVGLIAWTRRTGASTVEN